MLTLAVELAGNLGMTLTGFLQKHWGNIYTCLERIIF
jgi:formate dehydrogenase assembly factor FdhD